MKRNLLVAVAAVLLPFLLSCRCGRDDAPASSSAPAANPAVPVAGVDTTKPEEVVKSFVQLSAQAQGPMDRDRLQRLCVGEMRRAFERMTEEEFRLAYLNNALKVKSLDVVDAKKEPESAKIRYRIAVENAQGTDTTHEVNEREVELTNSRGAWYIETIRLKGTDKVAFTNGMMF